MNDLPAYDEQFPCSECGHDRARSVYRAEFSMFRASDGRPVHTRRDHVMRECLRCGVVSREDLPKPGIAL